MNLVFMLSRPLDLSPFLPEPVPPELYTGPETCWFDTVYREFEPYFPDAFHFVIDGCPKPVYYKMEDNPDADVLNIPSSALFPKLFLFSAFSRAFLADPFSLFVPANLRFDSIDPLAVAIRRLQKQAHGTGGVTLFPPDRPGGSGRFIEAGDEIDSWDGGKLRSLKRFMSSQEAFSVREKDPLAPLYSVPDILAMNTFDFSETLCESDDRLKELFFLLISAWKDGKTINTLMPDVIAELAGHTFESALEKTVDRFVCPVGGGLETLKGYRGLMQMLPMDESGNYTEGEVVLSGVNDTIALAAGTSTLRLEGLSGAVCLSKSGETRIFMPGENP